MQGSLTVQIIQQQCSYSKDQAAMLSETSKGAAFSSARTFSTDITPCQMPTGNQHGLSILMLMNTYRDKYI